MEVFLISLHYHYIEWILAGKMMNNPMCVPVNRSVYLSKYKHGKALHNVKASPTRTETIIQQIPVNGDIVKPTSTAGIAPI